MKRTKILILIGIFVTAIGRLVALKADSLATRWQSIGPGIWGGATDVDLRLTYHQIGIVAVCLGAALLALTAWSWIVAGRHAARPTICGKVSDRYKRNELQILLVLRR